MTTAPKFDAEKVADDVAYSWDRSFIGFISEPELGKLARHIETTLRDVYRAGEEAMREQCAKALDGKWGYDDDLRKSVGMSTTANGFAELIRAIPTEP
jgi:hypothetical protein